MRHEGKAIIEVSVEKEKNLTVEQQLCLFTQVSGGDTKDRMILLIGFRLHSGGPFARKKAGGI